MLRTPFCITFAREAARTVSCKSNLKQLSLGLLISTVSQTQAQAMQMALFVMLPSIILSGFVFPREGMPHPIRELGLLIPLTYFLQILRGIILKGVGVEVLWPEVPLSKRNQVMSS